MIRVVLDTNILASGAIAETGDTAELNEAWRRGDLDVIVSAHIMAELEHARGKPYFVRRLPSGSREEYLALVSQSATVVQISVPIPDGVASRADNIVLATPQSTEAPYLVTGDAELQRLGNYGNVTIVSSRQFYELIVSDQGQRR